MEAQIFLFTGENAYQLLREKLRWIAQFTEKHGPENISRLDGPTLKLRNLLDEACVAPFLASKRLIIVNGVPKLTREEIAELAAQIHPSCIVAFFDPKPDKRTTGVKELMTTAKVTEFRPLEAKALLAWLRTSAAESGRELTAPAAERMLERVGDDQQMLSEELHKILLVPGDSPLSVDDVDRLVVPGGDQVVWDLLRLLCARDLPAALRYERDLLASGESPFSVWSVLLWMLKNLVHVTIWNEQRSVSPGDVARELKVAFPTANSLIAFARTVSPDQLRDFLHETVTADRDLKTGGYRATEEAPQELTALIDRFVVRCCALGNCKKTLLR